MTGRQATPLDHLRDRLTESYDPLAGPTVTIPRALLRDTMTALYRSTGAHDDLLDLLARYAYKEAPDA